MSYKLHLPDGLVIEVDTSSELAEAVRVMRPTTAPVPALVVEQSDAAIPEAATYRRFLKGLPEKQRKILDCLSIASGGVPDERLWAVLGIIDNSKLGGIMGALSKKADKAGMTIKDAFSKQSRQDTTGRHYTYTITEAMRTTLTN